MTYQDMLKNEIKEKELIIREEREIQKLRDSFMFYVGDNFHNFGTTSWFNSSKHPSSTTLSPETCHLISELFLHIRFVALGHPCQYARSIKDLLTLLEFKEELITAILNQAESGGYLEAHRTVYKVILIGMYRVMPAVTAGNYGDFPTYEVNPQSLEEFNKAVKMLNPR